MYVRGREVASLKSGVHWQEFPLLLKARSAPPPNPPLQSPADARGEASMAGASGARLLSLDAPRTGYEPVAELSIAGVHASRVTRVTRREDGVACVLKVFAARFPSRRGVDVALSEQLLQRRLASPHVLSATAVSFDEDASLLTLEMPFARGGSLEAARRRAEGGALSPTALAWIALSVARGLKHLHAAGVVHRNVKPSNILLVRSREPPKAGGDTSKEPAPSGSTNTRKIVADLSVMTRHALRPATAPVPGEGSGGVGTGGGIVGGGRIAGSRRLGSTAVVRGGSDDLRGGGSVRVVREAGGDSRPLTVERGVIPAGADGTGVATVGGGALMGGDEAQGRSAAALLAATGIAAPGPLAGGAGSGAVAGVGVTGSLATNVIAAGTSTVNPGDSRPATAASLATQSDAHSRPLTASAATRSDAADSSVYYSHFSEPLFDAAVSADVTWSELMLSDCLSDAVLGARAAAADGDAADAPVLYAGGGASGAHAHHDDVDVAVSAALRISEGDELSRYPAPLLARGAAFAAPELLRDTGEAAGAPADIWALGAILFASATGQLVGATPEARAAIRRGTWAVDDALPDGSLALERWLALPPDLQALIHACLLADPSLRPTAAALERHGAVELGLVAEHAQAEALDAALKTLDTLKERAERAEALAAERGVHAAALLRALTRAEAALDRRGGQRDEDYDAPQPVAMQRTERPRVDVGGDGGKLSSPRPAAGVGKAPARAPVAKSKPPPPVPADASPQELVALLLWEDASNAGLCAAAADALELYAERSEYRRDVCIAAGAPAALVTVLRRHGGSNVHAAATAAAAIRCLCDGRSEARRVACVTAGCVDALVTMVNMQGFHGTGGQHGEAWKEGSKALECLGYARDGTRV